MYFDLWSTRPFLLDLTWSHLPSVSRENCVRFQKSCSLEILLGFRVNVESNSHFFLFYFTTLNDWLKKNALLSQPIRTKNKTNRNSTVTNILPRFSPATSMFTSCFYWNFSILCDCPDDKFNDRVITKPLNHYYHLHGTYIQLPRKDRAPWSSYNRPSHGTLPEKRTCIILTVVLEEGLET